MDITHPLLEGGAWHDEVGHCKVVKLWLALKPCIHEVQGHLINMPKYRGI
ncbi:hypothetical protein SPBRAN_881 [uncultured Candidatus Thioglobus sp.]|nr:hypothetical protein SPBRAN_881 [uncultured Candidatus Thioglobus sp.]